MKVLLTPPLRPSGTSPLRGGGLMSLLSTRGFFEKMGKLIPWLWGFCLITLSYGVVGALLLAPPDYQQGEAYRIIFLHVPCAILSMGIYAFVALMSVVYLIWRVKMMDILAKTAVPLGALFTVLALLTGSFWGKPMWGTWWIWDARLTSELVLLFLYIGLIALRSSIPNREKAAMACALIALVGIIDLPIIHYSVNWWFTLHQKSTILGLHKPMIANAMLFPLLSMILAFAFYFLVILISRARTEILEREQHSEWVKQFISKVSPRGLS